MVIRFRAGPAWRSGPPEEQPGWDEHAAFVDGLVERGIFVLGGPYSDFSGSHVVYQGVDAAEARRIVAADPFLANGVFELEDVRDWTVYVDALSERGKGSDPSTGL